jgi:hypothetical protein
MLRQFLQAIQSSPLLRDRIKTFGCKDNCNKCGLCVVLASELGLQISAKEMDQARQQFLAGTLVAEGIPITPDEQKLKERNRRRYLALIAHHLGQRADVSRS